MISRNRNVLRTIVYLVCARCNPGLDPYDPAVDRSARAEQNDHEIAAGERDRVRLEVEDTREP
jgi:hypothetical protein